MTAAKKPHYCGANPKLTPEQRAEIVRLRRSGMTVDDVAARFDVDRTTVKKYARLAGFIDRSGPKPATGHHCIRRVGTRWHVRVDGQHIGSFGSLDEALACRKRCGR